MHWVGLSLSLWWGVGHAQNEHTIIFTKFSIFRWSFLLLLHSLSTRHLCVWQRRRISDHSKGFTSCFEESYVFALIRPSFPQALLVWSTAGGVDHWLSRGMRFHCQTSSLFLTHCKVNWNYSVPLPPTLILPTSQFHSFESQSLPQSLQQPVNGTNF